MVPPCRGCVRYSSRGLEIFWCQPSPLTHKLVCPTFSQTEPLQLHRRRMLMRNIAADYLPLYGPTIATNAQSIPRCLTSAFPRGRHK